MGAHDLERKKAYEEKDILETTVYFGIHGGNVHVLTFVFTATQ